jgi:hypothetical protein
MGSRTLNGYYPPYPQFTSDLVDKCKSTRDFMPLLFEWYKYVALITNLVASIRISDSKHSVVQLAILRGMLNRCSRLMSSSLRLAATGRHGESVRVFTRLVTESAAKIEWLASRNSDSDFKRYLAGGLKAEVKLKEQIENNIAARNGKTIEIEKRMLGSITRYMKLSGLSDDEILHTPDVPDLASMYRDLNLSDEQYVSLYRLGSQYIHGTWSDLLTNYLRVDDQGNFVLRDHDVIPDQSEFSATCLVILRSLSTYVIFLFDDLDLRQVHLDYFGEIRDKILEIFGWTAGNDYRIADDGS